MKRRRTDVMLLVLMLIGFIVSFASICDREESNRLLKTLLGLALLLFIIKIVLADFKAPLKRVVAAWNEPPKMEDLSEEDLRLVSIHEASHAVAEWFLPHHPAPASATIVPDRFDRSYGRVVHHPHATRFLKPSHYKDMIAACLVSHATETLIFGEASTGCRTDIQHASKLAEDMVRFYGMGKTVGPLAPGYLTENTAWHLSRTIAEDVERIIKEQHERVNKIVTEHRSKIERVAQALLKRKTLATEDLEEILGPRPGGKRKT